MTTDTCYSNNTTYDRKKFKAANKHNNGQIKTEHISLVEKKRSPCINVISIMFFFFKWSSLICVPVDF